MIYTKKRGFSLTEVLIALAITGIVAALTLPGMVSHTTNSIISTSIGRGVELLESGMRSVFSAAENNDVISDNLASLTIGDIVGNANVPANVNLESFLADGTNLFEFTKHLFNIEDVENNYFQNAKLYNGTDMILTYPFVADAHIYRFKKMNICIMVQPITEALADNVGKDEIVTRIFIDANGEKVPNTVGQDIFMFGIANSGRIIPAGSVEYNNNTANVNEELPLYTATCTNDNITTGLSCAARIAVDGWRINY